MPTGPRSWRPSTAPRPSPRLAEALAAVETDVVAHLHARPGLTAALAIEALRAGKHVIIEKPAEITVARTDEIIAAQREAGTQVAVISQHRFDPSTEIAVAAIADGELGRLTSGIASIDWWRGQNYYDSGDWRGTWELDGGGALMNQGVHTVDLLVATLGRPVEVFAYTGTLAHERIEVEDVTVGVVRFENGALGVLHATTAAYPGLSARLQVHGDKGSIVIDNDELTFIHVTPPGSEGEETAYGSLGSSDQPGRGLLTEPKAGRQRGQRPGRAVDLCAPAPVRELPGRAGRRGAPAGRPRDQPAGDRDHHRRVRVRPHRSPGEPRVSTPRVAANPHSLLVPRAARPRRSSTKPSPTSPRSVSPPSRLTSPMSMKPEDYLDWIGSYGLAPSLSLFNSAFDETVDISDEVERAKRFGAVAGRRWGSTARWSPRPGLAARRNRPAVGADFSTVTGWRSPSRTAASSARCCRPRACARCITPMSAESSRPRRRSPPCSTQLGPDVIGFGPDTGHLRWAGIDPAAFIAALRRPHRRHPSQGLLPRLPGRRRGGRDELLRADWPPSGSGANRGWGSSTSTPCSTPLPDDYDGDFMIEIDEPSVDSLFESHRIASSGRRTTCRSRKTSSRRPSRAHTIGRGH